MEKCQRCDGRRREITKKRATIEGQTHTDGDRKMGEERYSKQEMCVPVQ